LNNKKENRKGHTHFENITSRNQLYRRIKKRKLLKKMIGKLRLSAVNELRKNRCQKIIRYILKKLANQTIEFSLFKESCFLMRQKPWHHKKRRPSCSKEKRYQIQKQRLGLKFLVGLKRDLQMEEFDF